MSACSTATHSCSTCSRSVAPSCSATAVGVVAGGGVGTASSPVVGTSIGAVVGRVVGAAVRSGQRAGAARRGGADEPLAGPRLWPARSPRAPARYGSSRSSVGSRSSVHTPDLDLRRGLHRCWRRRSVRSRASAPSRSISGQRLGRAPRGIVVGTTLAVGAVVGVRDRRDRRCSSSVCRAICRPRRRRSSRAGSSASAIGAVARACSSPQSRSRPVSRARR